MLDGTIIFLAGAWAALLGFRLVGKRPGEDRRWDAWHRRFGRHLKVLGPILAVIGLVLLGQDVVANRSAPVEARPPDPALRAKGGIVRSEPLRFELSFAEPWEVQPRRPEVDVLVLHPPSDAVLVASAQVTSPPAATAQEILESVVEGRRERWSEVREVERGATKVGEVAARWVAFTVARGEDLARMKVTIAQKGPYTLSFTCTGPAAAQEACDDALGGATLSD